MGLILQAATEPAIALTPGQIALTTISTILIVALGEWRATRAHRRNLEDRIRQHKEDSDERTKYATEVEEKIIRGTEKVEQKVADSAQEIKTDLAVNTDVSNNVNAKIAAVEAHVVTIQENFNRLLERERQNGEDGG